MTRRTPGPPEREVRTTIRVSSTQSGTVSARGKALGRDAIRRSPDVGRRVVPVSAWAACGKPSGGQARPHTSDVCSFDAKVDSLPALIASMISDRSQSSESTSEQPPGVRACAIEHGLELRLADGIVLRRCVDISLRTAPHDATARRLPQRGARIESHHSRLLEMFARARAPRRSSDRRRRAAIAGTARSSRAGCCSGMPRTSPRPTIPRCAGSTADR